MMTSAQVVETSIATTNNSPCQIVDQMLLPDSNYLLYKDWKRLAMNKFQVNTIIIIGECGGEGRWNKVSMLQAGWYKEIIEFTQKSSAFVSTGISLKNPISRAHHARKNLPTNLKGVLRNMDLIKLKSQSITHCCLNQTQSRKRGLLSNTRTVLSFTKSREKNRYESYGLT